MDGLVLVDKPCGPTSQQISAWVSEIAGNKTCHCGTLDPYATGVLPILVGKAVKMQEFLQEHDKEYIAAIRFGQAPAPADISKVLNEFVGKVYQKPPKMSAVAKRTRVRKVYDARLLELNKDTALVQICCEHGFYVRKLADDIGKVLGTKAELVALRRTRVNGFHEKECMTLTSLKDAKETGRLEKAVLSVEEAARSMAKAFLKESAVQNVSMGAPLYAPGVEKYAGWFPKGAPLAYMRGEKLVGIGVTLMESHEAKEKRTGIIAKTRKVMVAK